MAQKLSKSRAAANKIIFGAFQVLKENGGEMRGKDLIAALTARLSFTEYELERYEKTGYVRWQSLLHFFSIDCQKAGFLRKEKGVWSLTPEGEQAMQQGDSALLDMATKKYREWDALQKEKGERPSPTETEVEPGLAHPQQQKALLSQYEEDALDGIRTHILSKGPYEFQEMVAGLLRAMGYHVPHVAPKGKDGGIDIIAYSDPLGTREPRIKVQVKHRPDAAVPLGEIHQMVGLLNKPGDAGLFVTSGRFSPDATRTARESHKHIELVDFGRFVSLWQEFYPRMNDEQKNMLPLHAIWFLGANE